MAIGQFLTAQSVPWLQPRDQGPENLLAGAQIGHNFMQNSMRERELKMKEEVHPLEKQILQGEQKMKELQIAQGLFMQQQRIQQQAGQTAAAGIAAELSSTPGALTDYNRVASELGKAVQQFGPSAWDNPFAQLLLETAYKGTALKDKFESADAALNAKVAIANANLAAREAGVLAKEGKQSPGMLAAEEIIATENLIRQANARGDSEQANELAQKLQLLKDSYPARQNEEISMGQDDQGRPIFKITKGGKSAGPTVATESKVQQNVLMGQKSHDLLVELEKQLDPADLGIRGVVGEAVMDRLVAQFAPGAANLERADSRTKLKVAIQGMVRQISSDQRFSEADRKRAEDAMMSAGPFESYPRALQAIRTIKDVLEKRGAMDSEAGKMTRPEWTLSAEEIRSMYKNKQLDEAKATELLQRYHPTIRPRQ